jgi:hypothetical protein
MKAYISPNGDVTVWLGALPSSYDGFFLDITEAEKPAAQEGHQVVDGPLEITRENGVPVAVSTSWVETPLLLAPITKLTLKTRVTPQEWGAIKAAIAGASEDIQEDWTLAKEIDPQHPQTAAMISALQGAGYLTTPLHVIFAP